MRLVLSADTTSTILDNRFIDYYMPTANGEFVKVYLYLLRHVQSDRNTSVSAAADALSCTEKDILRALQHWSRESLISLTPNKRGSIEEIVFLPIPPAPQYAHTAATSAQHSASAEFPGSFTPASSAAVSGSIAQTAAAPGNSAQTTSGVISDAAPGMPDAAALRRVTKVAEGFFNRLLTPNEISALSFYMETFHFSESMVEWLIEYCAGKNAANLPYMQKVAESWHAKNITTPQQARDDSRLYNQNYFEILRALGITGRSPAAVEYEYMDKWIDDYHFAMDMILLACSRTMLSKAKADFRYTDAILKNWLKEGLRTPEAVEKSDALKSKTQAASAASKSPSAGGAASRKTAGSGTGANAGASKAPSGKKGKFGNFDQRSTDYSDIVNKRSITKKD